MSKRSNFAYWQSQRDKLEDLYYNQKLSSNEIGKLYGVYGETITFNMNKLGFKLRKVGDASRINAKYQINSSFFDDINNEKTAYVLGYTITDGHVTPDGALMYCARDKDVIEKVHDALESTHPITTKMQAGNEYYLFTARSKMLCKKLWDLGIDNKKSYTLNMDLIEEKIDKENIRHLLRGMIDGDGSIQCTMNTAGANKKHTLGIAFTKTQSACSFVCRNLDITNKWRDEGSGVYTVRTNNRDKVIAIGHYLYDDATIYMDRKKHKFDELCQVYEKEK